MLRICVLCLTLLLSVMGCKSQTFQEHLLEPPPPLINFALTRNGATAHASQSVPNHRAEEVIDGDTNSETWDEGSGWGSSLEHLRTSDLNKRPYVSVTLAKPVDIREIVMWTIDSEKYPAPQFGLKTIGLSIGTARVGDLFRQAIRKTNSIPHAIIPRESGFMKSANASSPAKSGSFPFPQMIQFSITNTWQGGAPCMQWTALHALWNWRFGGMPPLRYIRSSRLHKESHRNPWRSLW